MSYLTVLVKDLCENHLNSASRENFVDMIHPLAAIGLQPFATVAAYNNVWAATLPTNWLVTPNTPADFSVWIQIYFSKLLTS